MSLGQCLVTGRSLAEYRAMFALADADLAARILDCPGGAASLVAEVRAAGGYAVAATPRTSCRGTTSPRWPRPRSSAAPPTWPGTPPATAGTSTATSTATIPAFHLAAALELARVGARARIYPLVPHTGGTYDGLAALRHALEDRGVRSEVRAVGFEFQRGATQMLVLTRG